MLIPLMLTLCSSANASFASDPEPSRPVVAVAVQDEDEIKDKRPEIKEHLDKLKGHIGKRGDQDREAVALIDVLVGEYPRCGPKDRAAVVKGIGKCFEQKRQELSKDIPNNQLYLAAAVSLGEMGEPASATLVKWISNKKHRKNLALRRAMILSLGKTKDQGATEDLLDLLNDKDNIIIASAAEALGEFDGAPQKLRKEVFSDLMKILVTAKAVKDGDINDYSAREKWDVISAPITTTLQVLSGHDETKPEGWQRWWNKNKKRDWDEEE